MNQTNPISVPMVDVAHLSKPILLCMMPVPAPDSWLTSTLLFSRFHLLRTDDAETAVELMKTCNPDLLLLEPAAIEKNAIVHVVEGASKLFSIRWPIVLLGSADDPRQSVLTNRVEAEIGKDYDEALAVTQLRAVLRRTRPAALIDRLDWGELIVDQLERRVLWGRQTLSLSFLEFNLLALFLDSAGMTWTPDELLQMVGGPRSTSDAMSISRRLQKLRGTLQRLGGVDPIETVKGIGFRLAELPS